MARLVIKLDEADLRHYVGHVRNDEIHAECRPGLLSLLTTTDKSSLVGAINEVRSLALNAAPIERWKRYTGNDIITPPAGDSYMMWTSLPEVGNLPTSPGGQGEVMVSTSMTALRIYWGAVGRFMRITGNPNQSIEITCRLQVHRNGNWEDDLILSREKLLLGDAYAWSAAVNIDWTIGNPTMLRVVINCDLDGAQLNMSAGVGNYWMVIHECFTP